MDLQRFIDVMLTFGSGGVGIDRWSLYASSSRGLSLGIKDRETGNAHTPMKIAEGCGALYLLVWSDGTISRGRLERRQLEHDAVSALEQARSAAYDDPDAAQVLAPAPIPDLSLHNERAAALAGGETEPLIGRLAEVRRRVDEHRFETWSGSFSAGEADSRLVNSAGVDLCGRGTVAGWHVAIGGKIGDGFASRDIEPDPDFTARLDRLVGLIVNLERRAPAMPGGTRPVLLHPNVVERFVLGTLLQNLGGAGVSNEESHFRREQFGSPEPVMREDLSLRLDPLQPLKSGSYLFTAEGVPAARCEFVRRGRLVQPILDLKYATRLGLRPTPIPNSMDTLYFEGPRRLTFEEAAGKAEGGALVLSVLGVHTQDAASGDFSLSAPHSLRLGDGGYMGALRCTISGNLFSILKSDDLEFVEFDGEHTPGLLARCRLDPD